MSTIFAQVADLGAAVANVRRNECSMTTF
ncbi:hypothetical protein DSM3645_07141 [Blastopirellula marina DSM 3645]|uniref:Uncharacterized protein n=1 Tax=Blastopirellula marina DSM 3645 TaxID=314230 RepID=A3ZYN4_9BACT|nr:hypothetical protein DSM3645_07141 [Blastopirellula marina DSM 3645]